VAAAVWGGGQGQQSCCLAPSMIAPAVPSPPDLARPTVTPLPAAGLVHHGRPDHLCRQALLRLFWHRPRVVAWLHVLLAQHRHRGGGQVGGRQQPCLSATTSMHASGAAASCHAHWRDLTVGAPRQATHRLHRFHGSAGNTYARHNAAPGCSFPIAWADACAFPSCASAGSSCKLQPCQQTKWSMDG